MCIRLYMYISLKIDKSQWCEKTYQVIAYSLIKKSLSSKKYRHLTCKIYNACMHTNAYQTTDTRAHACVRVRNSYTHVFIIRARLKLAKKLLRNTIFGGLQISSSRSKAHYNF